MLEPVSVGLKFGFLAVLYLFLLWVSRNALKDLRRTSATISPQGHPPAPPPADATGIYSPTGAGRGAGGLRP